MVRSAVIATPFSEYSHLPEKSVITALPVTRPSAALSMRVPASRTTATMGQPGRNTTASEQPASSRNAKAAVPIPAAFQPGFAVLSSLQIFIETGLVIEAVGVLPASGTATI